MNIDKIQGWLNEHVNKHHIAAIAVDNSPSSGGIYCEKDSTLLINFRELTDAFPDLDFYVDYNDRIKSFYIIIGYRV